MVIGAFPVAKLGALLLKQISKPIANIVMQQAKNSPVFRTYICMPPAQIYNWIEVKSKMWILNLGKPVNIPVLNEAMAIELGANLLGEGIIFLIAAGILLSEYNRSVRKEAAKEQAKKEEMEAINRTIQELFFQAEQHGTQIREIMRIVSDLETRVVQKPWIPKSERLKDLDELITETTKPPHQTMPILQETPLNQTEHNTSPTPNLSSHLPEYDNVLLNSVRSVEMEMWRTYEEGLRQPGIVSLALEYFYKEVYRGS